MKTTLTTILIGFLFTACCKNKEESLKVGQTYKFIYGENNPYEKPRIYFRQIIDIQGDYLLYIQNKKDTLNDTKKWFLLGATLVN